MGKTGFAQSKFPATDTLTYFKTVNQPTIDKAAQEWINQGREEKKPAVAAKARQTTTIILDADLHTKIKVYFYTAKGHEVQ